MMKDVVHFYKHEVNASLMVYCDQMMTMMGHSIDLIWWEMIVGLEFHIYLVDYDSSKNR
jgi:hypothetical protein